MLLRLQSGIGGTKGALILRNAHARAQDGHTRIPTHPPPVGCRGLASGVTCGLDSEPWSRSGVVEARHNHRGLAWSSWPMTSLGIHDLNMGAPLPGKF